MMQMRPNEIVFQRNAKLKWGASIIMVFVFLSCQGKTIKQTNKQKEICCDNWGYRQIQLLNYNLKKEKKKEKKSS